MLAMPQEDAKQEVVRQAEAIRVAVGADRFSQAKANVTPCEGRRGELSDSAEVYYVQGIYQMLIPVAEHLTVLAKARSALESSGYTIEKERTFPVSGGGEITAGAANGYSASLTSGDELAMLLMVSSPCYRTPAA
ncbi:hypothetical protein [Actinoplanes aureus]|uniref:Uncharacterized protein n=1 Tax=Actinoplanes aureus TaxID=2792083 RepID=A0A931FZC5_9ACTN|nr:hypothetical protein [Actinoplanes aureus]MBG0564630.1 hypothetical protein [Actinoplanes aureus]